MTAGTRAAVACFALVAASVSVAAQGGRGGPTDSPRSPRAAAPVDLTGVWVSVVTEDWQWRMVTPKKGDAESVPLNDEGRRVLNLWEPSMDGRCEAYGAGGVMRMPGRVRISWQDDATLKVETDAGSQTRLLRFRAAASGNEAGRRRAPAVPRPTLQGQSVAEWLGGGAGNIDPFTGRGDGPGAQRWGALKVVTTNLLPGWLRRNGVPYSENAIITEHFTRFTHPQAGDWFVVTTTVEDPTYLATPFTTSSNFRKEPDASKWRPSACRPS